MGLFKDQGDPALALAEESSEVIRLITKKYRFDQPWDSCRPEDKRKTRFEELEAEMDDLFYQWLRLKAEITQSPKTLPM